jgi:hypothetical protein
VVDLVLLTKNAHESALTGAGVTVITVPTVSTHPIAAQVCAEIHQRNPKGPIVFVTEGELANLLPSIAFAQRTAHRAVVGYVLVDPTLGSPALDWPDAPVLVLSHSNEDERLANLRGWSFRQITNPESVSRCVEDFVSNVTPI